MKLSEIVRDLSLIDGDLTIYAAEPWSADSHAEVMLEPNIGGLPDKAKALGLKYFIEVFIARGFLEDWEGSLDIKPTSQETVARLIQYAINDA